MKFSNYLNEAYTPEMKKVLGPYLTDIGNALSKANVSVQNLDFIEVQLPKPVVFNSVFKYLNDNTEESRYIRNYQKSLGTTADNYYDKRFEYVVCIFKHAKGGVSVCVANVKSNDVRRPEDTTVISYGDTDSKVTNVFIAEITRSEMENLRTQHIARREQNRPGSDRHNISHKIHNKLSYNDNPNLKAISVWASKLGFKDYKPYTTYKDGKYYLMGNYGGTDMNLPADSWGKIFTIKPNADAEFVSHKGDEKVRYELEIDMPRLELDLKRVMSFKELENKLKVLDDFKSACLKVKEFADYINTFTYEDLVWDKE